jgi:hypothetical protein
MRNLAGSSFLLASVVLVASCNRPSKRLNVLAFEFVNLGEHESQSRDGNGRFFDDFHGNWVLQKAFPGKAGGCEVFINLNPVIRKGQIRDEG